MCFFCDESLRSGRTGRAGREGRAITFFTSDELEHPNKLRHVVNVMKQSGWEVPDYLGDGKKLSQLPSDKRQRKFYTESGQPDRKLQKQADKRQKAYEKQKEQAKKSNKRKPNPMDEEIDSD
jgi:ATP-dependent RNA helicase DDX52/ROK1